MLPDVNQDELTFQEAAIWERRVREKPKAYSAFLVYRDLGRSRSLLKAYSAFKAREAGEKPTERLVGAPVEVERGGDSSPPNWRRWRVVYEWDKRAEAWDAHQQKTRETREAEADRKLWENRRQQKELLDELRWARVLKMGQLIDNTMASAQPGPGGLASILAKQRTEKDTEQGKVTSEVDLVRQLEVLCEQERELVRDYFGEATGGSEAEDGNPIPVSGEFRWVPDPALETPSGATSDTPPIPVSSSSTETPPDSKD